MTKIYGDIANFKAMTQLAKSYSQVNYALYRRLKICKKPNTKRLLR